MTRPPAVLPGDALRQYFEKLFSVFGPQKWWPAETRLEIILGAILEQNTAWHNAALALKRLKQKGWLTLAGLRRASTAELESSIRPAGFYRQKTRTIQNFLAWLESVCGGSLATLFALPADDALRQFLAIKGLGPETVDAILLYAGGHPFFVADAYARRILSRHGLLHPKADYVTTREFLHRHLPADASLFNEYHALLVEVGKRYCARQAPRCEECPLREFLPSGQLVQLASSIRTEAEIEARI